MKAQEIVQKLQLASQKLAQMDPQDEAVQRTVTYMQQGADLLSSVDKPTGEKGSPNEASRASDLEDLKTQIERMKRAAEIPAGNYGRIAVILSGLNRAVEIASKPQYASMRPRIALITEKIAGIFAEVDTVADLSVPLESIEKAVHGLYSNGKMNSPGTYNFEQSGKGHRNQSK